MTSASRWKRLLPLFMLITGSLLAQDLPLPDNPYDAADEVTKRRNAFLRERWFYEQRMYPFNRLPDDAYGNALRQRDELRRAQGFRDNTITWTSLGPISGYYFSYGNISGRTTTVKYDPNNPNVIYIGAAFGGMWKSTNGGTSWIPKTDFETSLASGALAIDPTNSNIIYYGTGEATYSGASYYGRGLLKSTDGGTTWTNYTSGLQAFTYFSRIVIRPNYPNQLLAALGNRSSPSATGGLYRSTNGGATWSVVVSGRADDVVFSPTGDTAYAVGIGIGYRVSTDGGQTFTSNSVLTMQTRNHIAICRSMPSTMYVATYLSGISVFKSTNAGFTFTQVAVGTDFSASQAWYDFYIHVNPFDPNYVYVGSIDVWRSTNGGTSFQNITNGYSGGSVHVDQHNLDFHPTDPNRMFCVNDGGVWHSTDRGTSWTNLNAPLALTQFYRIACDPSAPSHILGGTQDNGTQRTTGTLNWAAAFGGDGGEVCFHSQNPANILGETQNNGIYRSTSGGSSWASSTSGLSGTGAWVGPIVSHPDSVNIFYTARQSVYKSTDGGASWFSISSGISGTIREMAVSKSDPKIMFATISSSIYKSTNRGYSWSLTSSGLPSRTITSVYVHPESSNVVLVTFSGFGAGKVYRSTNTGSTWTDISGNLPDTPVNDLLIYYPGYSTGKYLVGTDVGVFITENYGASWTELADGLPNTVAIHLDYHSASGKLRVGTHGRGVYETILAQATISVAAPNGGETWIVGTSHTIQWSWSNLAGNVKIELSRNGGSTYETLFASTANDGSESWTVSGSVTSQARIRITSIDLPSVNDASDADFSIAQQSITVVVPNGGEVWPVAISQTIRWTSSLITGDVKIELSRNGGSTFETLFASTPNDGSEAWIVTAPPTSQALVRISSVAVPGVVDVSSSGFAIVPQFAFLSSLRVQDNAGVGVTLEFGTAHGATDGIDPQYGEEELPPVPPAGAFDARWQIVSTQGSLRDVREVLGGARAQAIYTGQMQPGIGGYPMTLRWSRSQFPAGLFVLRDEFAGSFFKVNMRLEDSVVIANSGLRTFQVVYSSPDTLEAPVDLLWNMVSLPMTVVDRRVTQVFPSATSSAYAFSLSGYVARDTLRYKEGYWLKFAAAETLAIAGSVRDVDTIDVRQGWNMIGSISYSVPTTAVIELPGNLVNSMYFGYGPGRYVLTNVLQPMKGYWVKANQQGRLILTAPIQRRKE